MNVYVGNRLPSAYQEVEYIESSGTQRINTGINVSNDTTYGYECKIMPLSGNLASACPMEMGGTGTDNYRYGITYHLNNAEWQVGFNGGDKGWGTIVSGYGPYSSTEYTIAYNKQNSHTFAIDGTTRYSSFTPSNYYYSNNWNIFCQTYGSTYTRFAWMRLYYMKIYHGASLVRDFVPCYRKSDSVIGLYDLVNNQFYTNAGTGTFSKGSDVNELKNAYIGEYNIQTFDFQNKGNLGWTGFTKRGTPSYVSGQGWTIGTNSNDAYESGITPPSSIYKGTLREVKIWFSKNSVQTSSRGQGAGICNSDLSIYCHYSHPRSEGPAILYVNGTSYFTNVTNIYGEIYISYIFNDDNSMVVDINGTTYNIGNYASVFRGLWTNKNLCLDICRWGTDAPYIRKVQIETS